jgi:methyl coenzyme M reductase alpha subunit
LARQNVAVQPRPIRVAMANGTAHPTSISYDYSSKVIFRDHANVGAVMSGGQGNTQHVQQAISPDVRDDLTAQLADLIKIADELPDDTPGAEDVRQALADIGSEIAKPEPKPNMVKDLAVKALTVGAAIVGTSGGQMLVEGLGHFVKALGL